jgi:hypothetical protein
MYIVIHKIVITIILALVIINVSGCASSYVIIRNEFILENQGKNKVGKTRDELEKQWGNPVTYTENTDGTFTCTYEYDALTGSKTKPLSWYIPDLTLHDKVWDTLFIGSWIVVDTITFPYYFAKDIASIDRYEATITYDQDNIATREYYSLITDDRHTWSYEISPIVQARLAQLPPGKGILKFLVTNLKDSVQVNCPESFALSYSLCVGSVNAFILKAFNMELKAADRYDSQAGVHFAASIDWLPSHSDDSCEETIWGIQMQFFLPDGRTLKAQTCDIHFQESNCEELGKAFKLAVATMFENIVESSEFCSLLCNGDPRCPPSTESLYP